MIPSDPSSSDVPPIDLSSLSEDEQLRFLRQLKSRSTAQPAQPQSPARVLVVEDDVETARMLETVLQGLGYETRVCDDGAQALQAARDFAPDAVLMDIGLPHRDGYALALDMRADPALEHVPLVAVTGLAGLRDRERALAAGFAQHMAKPVSPPALDAALRALLANNRRSSASAAAG